MNRAAHTPRVWPPRGRLWRMIDVADGRKVPITLPDFETAQESASRHPPIDALIARREKERRA